MDSRPANYQAGYQHAGEPDESSGSRSLARLPQESHVNAPAPAVVTAAVLDDAAEHAQLQAVWHPPRGFIGWLMRVDHRSIGKRYIVTAFAFFVLAGILAVLMRLQLATAQNRLLGPDLYNQLFTVHGTAMM